jgi:hypothetical protein
MGIAAETGFGTPADDVLDLLEKPGAVGLHFSRHELPGR